MRVEYFVLENEQGEVERRDTVNAEVDIFFAEFLCQELKGEFLFQDVFPDVMEKIVTREGKNPFAKKGEVGLRTVVLMAMLCGMNIADAKGKESIELIPFLEIAKGESNWINGFHGLGALLFSVQENPVSEN